MLSSTGAWSRTTYIAHGSSPLMKVNVTHLQQNNGWHHLILSVFGHFQVFRLSSRRSGPAYHAAPHTKRWRRFHRFVIKPVPPGDKTTPGHNLTCCCWWTEPKPTLLTRVRSVGFGSTHKNWPWPMYSRTEVGYDLGKVCPSRFALLPVQSHDNQEQRIFSNNEFSWRIMKQKLTQN